MTHRAITAIGLALAVLVGGATYAGAAGIQGDGKVTMNVYKGSLAGTTDAEVGSIVEDTYFVLSGPADLVGQYVKVTDVRLTPGEWADLDAIEGGPELKALYRYVAGPGVLVRK